MSVDEKLAASRVPESTSFGRVAEQRGREPVQSASLGLEPLSGDVDDQSLTAARRTLVIGLADVVDHRRHHARLAVWGRREADGREERRRAERGARSGVVADVRTGDRRGGRRSAAVISRVATVTVFEALLRLILAIARTS